MATRIVLAVSRTVVRSVVSMFGEATLIDCEELWVGYDWDYAFEIPRLRLQEIRSGVAAICTRWKGYTFRTLSFVSAGWTDCYTFGACLTIQ